MNDCRCYLVWCEEILMEEHAKPLGRFTTCDLSRDQTYGGRLGPVCNQTTQLASEAAFHAFTSGVFFFKGHSFNTRADC
jgi:hypothetical protein